MEPPHIGHYREYPPPRACTGPGGVSNDPEVHSPTGKDTVSSNSPDISKGVISNRVKNSPVFQTDSRLLLAAVFQRPPCTAGQQTLTPVGSTART